MILSSCYLKFWFLLFSFQNMERQTIKFLNAGVKETLLCTRKFHSVSMQRMFSPCIHPVHNRVSLKIIEIVTSKHNHWKYIFTWYRWYFNFSLQEHLILTSIIILFILFCCRNSLVILVELPQQIIPYLFSEWKY
jgi:hypothetical protein